MSECRPQMFGEPDPAYEWCVQQHMRIDDLTRENADLRARLAEAEKVIADYTATIREHMDAEKAAKATNGEPMAWAVFCPEGDEYDYAVFPTREDARLHAELLDADEEEGTEPRGVIPLYADPSGAIAAAEKARDEQAEAVVQLGLCLRDAMKTMRYCQEKTCRCNSAANPCPRCRFNSSLGWIEWKLEKNATAAAAVKESAK